MQLKEQTTWQDKRLAAIHRISQSKGWTRFDDAHPYFEEWQRISNSKAVNKFEYKKDSLRNNVK
jgi:hypothetical protein